MAPSADKYELYWKQNHKISEQKGEENTFLI